MDMEKRTRDKEKAEREELARLSSITGGASVKTVALTHAPRILEIPRTPGGTSTQASLPGSPRAIRLVALRYDPD